VPRTTASAASGPIPARAGIGLRFAHHALAVAGAASADWLEVHAENYLHDAAARAELRAVAARYPLSIHAVGLSLGSAEGVDDAHLAHFAALVAELQPGLISDHLSWSRSGGVALPDLLPLPYTQEALAVVCRNVDTVQAAVGRPLLIENPSTYVQYVDSPLSEPQFLRALVERCGCGVLLDVNNVYVSACNRGVAAAALLDEYLAVLDARCIGELHLAGHAIVRTESGRTLRVDDHGSEVCAEVWTLYERCIATLGPRPTLIEWDTRIPAFEVLVAQAAQAQCRLDGLNARRVGHG
jgi:hypothetical protein